MVGSHQDSNIDHVRRCSWLHSPSQVEPTTIHKQDTVEKILEHRGEAEALPCATETETLHKQSKGSSYVLSTLPIPQARAAIHQEGSTAPPFPPVGKKEPRVNIQLPQDYWLHLGILLWPHLTGQAWLENLISCVTQWHWTTEYSRQSWSSTEHTTQPGNLGWGLAWVKTSNRAFPDWTGSLSLPTQRS